MMRRGFKFNELRCVGCKACVAACSIENEWSVQARSVFIYNPEAHPALPVINLSLACNHCEEPLCMNGCPSGAIFRDYSTGAVLIDEKKCIGCKYCIWNCPYDAPEFDTVKGIVTKCNLCYTGLTEGRIPACASACPTGALGYGEIPDVFDNNNLLWFPGGKMNPAIRIDTERNRKSPVIIPENRFKSVIKERKQDEKNIDGEWSLIGFSYLVTLSVAVLISSFLIGKNADKITFFSLSVSPWILSLFHLGKKFRAWRSVSNVISSPLSREITIYIAYLIISVAAVLSGYSGLILGAFLTGLLLLITIDSVYYFSDGRSELRLHSGQTFLTALLVASFLSGMKYPFIFIALIKLISAFYVIVNKKAVIFNFWFRYLRIALLIITGVSLITGIHSTEPVIIAFFLTGELIDRILFYYDFDPPDINKLITRQTNSDFNEKKRG